VSNLVLDKVDFEEQKEIYFCVSLRLIYRRWRILVIMRPLTIILALILNSCGLLSKYEYGQHRYFKNSLTEKEKKDIESNGTIIKRWAGYNNLGDSLIGDILVKRNTPYEFIEIGDWREKSMLTRNDKGIGTYNRDLKYDKSGNLIAMKSYFKKKDVADYFLIEQMESVIAGKGLKQIYKGFYDTGELQYKFVLLVTDYKAEKSDHLRKKIVDEPIGYFDRSGGQLSYLPMNPYYGVSKFTKMK